MGVEIASLPKSLQGMHRVRPRLHRLLTNWAVTMGITAPFDCAQGRRSVVPIASLFWFVILRRLQPPKELLFVAPAEAGSVSSK